MIWDKIRIWFLRLWLTFWIGLIPLAVIWYAIKEVNSIWGWVFVIGFLTIFGGGILIGVKLLWADDDWDEISLIGNIKGFKWDGDNYEVDE
jgi:hypothetical protein|tara:strand:- start:509 stop:781 length:273 start_codon:yes stop_codon:yes gene_type:complete